MNDNNSAVEASNISAIKSIAVIDDALVPASLSKAPEHEQNAVKRALVGALAMADLATRGFDEKKVLENLDAALDALTDPAIAKGDAFAQILNASLDLATFMDERYKIRQLIADLKLQSGIDVLMCDPAEPLPDLAKHQLVLIDYFLEGRNGDGQLAEELAGQIQAQREESKAVQQIVLMSSVGSVRTFRKSFRQKTHLSGADFAFIAKDDMDERWKVKAQLAMLSRALPHSGAIAEYLKALDQTITKAKDDLFERIHDLDLGDYAYLQSQALSADGHPLGDYISWLFSSHLTALVFEIELRKSQAKLDVISFEPHPVASTEPSSVVAHFYHSAIFSRNHGPLGPHPRATAGGKYSDFPLVQLGDVFFDSKNTKAVVVLSAACDLAFAPSEQREPDKETPVILVCGHPVSSTDDKGAGGPATHGVLKGNEVYRVDWSFADYRSVELGKLTTWLSERGFELGNRDRLRPLYSLKLQQEFGAHLLRVGSPVMPGVIRAMKGTLYRCAGDRKDLGEFEPGDVMLCTIKGKSSVRMTPTVVGRIKSECGSLLNDLNSQLSGAAAEGIKEKAIGDMRKRNDALERDIQNDDFWINILGDLPLNSAGTFVKRGQAVSIVQGTTWENPSKPCIVLEIAELPSAI